MNALKFLILLVFFKFNFSIAAEPLPFNNIVLHKNPLQVSQVKFKDFYLKDIEVNKNDGKIKVINFWATWCQPCKKEMPSLDNLSNLNKDILIYPVNLEKPNLENTIANNSSDIFQEEPTIEDLENLEEELGER